MECKLCQEMQTIDLGSQKLEIQLDARPGTSDMSILSIYQSGEYPRVAELKINYCPLCARSLNED